MVTTNQLKAGDKVRLSNGFTAVIKDNKKGNIRLAEVDGLVKEIGSIYAHDIVAFISLTGHELAIELTEVQKLTRARCKTLGF
jgi:hypothetical protein